MAQRQMCTLKLMFAHASLLLYRPFILHAIDSSSSSSSASSLSSPSKRDRWVKECHDRAITAANTVVSECRYLAQRGLFSRVFWLVNYTQFAAIGTLFMYSYLWPENAGVRQTAERALDQFPAGIDGDLVGQRYLETLKELRDMTAAPSPAAAYQTLPQPTEQGGELPANANANSGWLLDDAFWPNALFDPVFMDDFAGSGENQ
ncbi:hypothetical protein VTK73DRAFT_4710 [Phialemonium thermophilum]|uniref:Uncharacterized protein n=1 Tax=Phialemonium thermophilum TaxID=223376 RepID=A0ABR3V6I3_9PEZI